MTAVLWFLGAGLALLAVGGEGVIRGGVTMARALGFAPIITGFFALSLGTASPVLAVAVQANVAGLADMAVGVVVGATLINLLLILGLSAIIAPMPSAPKVVLRDGGAMLLASGALALLGLGGGIDRREGVFLLGALAAYSIITIVSDWRRSAEHSVACAEAESRSMGQPSASGGLFALAVGAICLVLGAHFVAGGSVALAHVFSLPVGTIALTVVAMVASLPVLVVTVVAVARGYTHVAIGHLITASVFNVFGALGLAALVRPLAVSSVFMTDIFVMLGASAFLLPLLSMNWRLSRFKGALLLLAYVGYVGFMAFRHGLIG